MQHSYGLSRNLIDLASIFFASTRENCAVSYERSGIALEEAYAIFPRLAVKFFSILFEVLRVAGTLGTFTSSTLSQ